MLTSGKFTRECKVSVSELEPALVKHDLKSIAHCKMFLMIEATGFVSTDKKHLKQKVYHNS